MSILNQTLSTALELNNVVFKHLNVQDRGPWSFEIQHFKFNRMIQENKMEHTVVSSVSSFAC